MLQRQQSSVGTNYVPEEKEEETKTARLSNSAARCSSCKTSLLTSLDLCKNCLDRRVVLLSCSCVFDRVLSVSKQPLWKGQPWCIGWSNDESITTRRVRVLKHNSISLLNPERNLSFHIKMTGFSCRPVLVRSSRVNLRAARFRPVLRV